MHRLHGDDARLFLGVQPVNVRMRLEPLFADTRKEVAQHRQRKITRHSAHATDHEIAVGRATILNRLGDQSMG